MQFSMRHSRTTSYFSRMKSTQFSIKDSRTDFTYCKRTFQQTFQIGLGTHAGIISTKAHVELTENKN